MSGTETDPKDTLHGLTVKDLSMLIVAISVGIFFATMAGVYWIGVANSKGIAFSGAIDLTSMQQTFLLFVGAAIAMIAGSIGAKQTLQAQG